MTEIRDSQSFRLFKNNHPVLDGVSSMVDMFSQEMNRYNIDETEREADLNSLRADWSAIGEDMQKAIDVYAAG